MDGHRAHPTSSGRAPERRPTGDRRDWRGLLASAAAADDRIPDASGTFRAAGCGPLQPGTAHAFGDRIPVPDGVEGPRPQRHVPVHAVGPNHEWRTRTGRPAVAPPATGTPSFQPPRAGYRQKQAAPHLRCGAAGVGAPVRARCSLSGEDCSRHPLNAPTSASGHRTSSVGGILLPDPPS